jgi:methylated-DNA-protein-cysteine methyltransferase-like protein
MDYIRKIPHGKVATYKQIAELAGKPHASRGVAWVLHSCATPYKLPWHRVVGSNGKIAFPKELHNFRQQKKRLEREGIPVEFDGSLKLAKYQWKKRPTKRKPSRGKPRMFS